LRFAVSGQCLPDGLAPRIASLDQFDADSERKAAEPAVFNSRCGDA
jgi:hypothetical protein